MNKVFIGLDFRMPLAFSVAVRSLLDQATAPIQVDSLNLPMLQAAGIYTRPTIKIGNNWHDVISSAPMSTQFAISRFLVPYLSGFQGWSVFCDSDFLFRADITEVFENADPSKAVMVVKHKYAPAEGFKMDGQKQTAYPRKNWSSFILFNNAHPRNQYLTIQNVNKDTGRALHGFHWIPDDEIGELEESWNWLEGHSSMEIEPKAVHFTRGTPDMAGYENVPYANEWRAYTKGLTACL